MMEDNGAHFFEGTEKLLEVWFSRQDETKGTGDLRTIPRFVSFECLSCHDSLRKHMETLAETPATYTASFPQFIRDIYQLNVIKILFSRGSLISIISSSSLDS